MTPLSRKNYIRQCKIADIFSLIMESRLLRNVRFYHSFLLFIFKEMSFNMFWMELKTSLEFFYKLGEGQTLLKLGQN